MADYQPSMITPNQIKRIKVWQKQAGLDDDTYRMRLLQDYQVRSCTHMTFKQASHFIGTIAQDGHAIPLAKKRRPPRSRKAAVPRNTKNVVKMASKAELEKIAALAKLIEWRVENGQACWMKKRFGFERVRTSQSAWLVIEGLKKMFENRMKKEYGARWYYQTFDDPQIMRYIQEHKV